MSAFEAHAREKWSLEVTKDPFNLSFDEFTSLSLEEASDLLTQVYELCKNLLREAWKKGARQVVICKGEIVYESEKLEDISNEVIEQLGKKNNKACYVFSAPDEIEESAWVPVTKGDYYPTINVYLGKEDSDERDIIENSSPINADLDTGNPIYKIFNAGKIIEPLTRFKPFQIRQGEHLRRRYNYFLKEAKICVMDVKRKINSKVYRVRLVTDWDGCALLQANPNRIGFVGRDILRDLGIKLELDSINNRTRILDVSELN